MRRAHGLFNRSASESLPLRGIHFDGINVHVFHGGYDERVDQLLRAFEGVTPANRNPKVSRSAFPVDR